MNEKPIPPKSRILREGEMPVPPVSCNQKSKLENKIHEKKEGISNKVLIHAFLLAGTACLGMGYFFDDKSLSTLGYVGAGIYYFTAGVYSFGDTIIGYLKK